MKFTPSEVFQTAETTGFNAEMVEKVLHLQNLLKTFDAHPFLRNKWVLKGGTALNMFILDLPRLSVDIDLNYIGQSGREEMLAERPKFEEAAQAVFSREGLNIKRVPDEHTGGKWRLGYESFTGQSGNLEVDLNFMFRVPLWPVQIRDSFPLGTWQTTGIPVIDNHELAAGKLAALLARKQARDLFDSHRILQMRDLDSQRLRIGFVVYGAMNRKDWRTVSSDDVDFDKRELGTQLVPMLRSASRVGPGNPDAYGSSLVEECRQSFSAVLPLNKAERKFLDLLLDKGEINPALLTDIPDLQERIASQPLLEWKALNVRQHGGLS